MRETRYFPVSGDIDDAIAALEAIRDEHAAEGTSLKLVMVSLPENGNQLTTAVRLRRRVPD